MTDEQRAELRGIIVTLLGWCASGGDCKVSINDRQQGQIDLWSEDPQPDNHPPLTTPQQLALSVLLGEPVPIGVLLSACEDAGVFPNGVLEEVRRQAYEQGLRDATPFAELAKSVTPAMTAYAEAMAGLGRRIADSLAIPLDVAGDHPSTPPPTS